MSNISPSFKELFGCDPDPASRETRVKVYRKLSHLADEFMAAANSHLFSGGRIKDTSGQFSEQFHEAVAAVLAERYKNVPGSIQEVREGAWSTFVDQKPA